MAIMAVHVYIGKGELCCPYVKGDVLALIVCYLNYLVVGCGLYEFFLAMVATPPLPLRLDVKVPSTLDWAQLHAFSMSPTLASLRRGSWRNIIE